RRLGEGPAGGAVELPWRAPRVGWDEAGPEPQVRALHAVVAEEVTPSLVMELQPGTGPVGEARGGGRQAQVGKIVHRITSRLLTRLRAPPGEGTRGIPQRPAELLAPALGRPSRVEVVTEPATHHPRGDRPTQHARLE